MKNKLRITEIFYSLQGETRTVGLPTVFVRLTGCPLRCQYCDTAYAFQGGQLLSLEDITAQVNAYQPRYVTVTGGEPLAQPLCHELLASLCDAGYTVSLETSGALDVSAVDQRVVKVIDLKTPGSLESHRNLYSNMMHLLPQDQVKFVICNREDYEFAKQQMDVYHLPEKCDVLLSPSFQQLENELLANWMIQDNLRARFQIQLHKYIWGDRPGV